MSRPVTSSEPMTPIAAASGGFQQVSITTTAATLASKLSSAVIPADARHALFYPETKSIRWRADGTAPTAAVGTVMAVDTLHVFENQRGIFDNMKLISADASSAATLNVHFFK